MFGETMRSALAAHGVLTALAVTAFLLAGGTTGLADTTQFPVRYSARVSEPGGECGDGRIREQIVQDVREILRAEVIPLLGERECEAGDCEANPASSCRQLSNSSSRTYWVKASNGTAVKVFCAFHLHCVRSACRGLEDGWVRVAYLNMTDPSHHCPEGFELNLNEGRRLCGNRGSSCVSATFPSRGVPFRRVCGRVLGYQIGEPDAFKPYHRDNSRTIDDLYVDGVSITHGRAPRRHIWTLAAAQDESPEVAEKSYRVCPCSHNVSESEFGGTVPEFVGTDYFCETGSRSPASPRTFYGSDPLWDGLGCANTSSCCEWNEPPWFCKQLDTPTTDSVEVRLCSDSGNSNEDTPLELIEIYVQ